MVVFGRGQDSVFSTCFLLKVCGRGIEILDCIFESSANEAGVYFLNSLLNEPEVYCLVHIVTNLCCESWRV